MRGLHFLVFWVSICDFGVRFWCIRPTLAVQARHDDFSLAWRVISTLLRFFKVRSIPSPFVVIKSGNKLTKKLPFSSFPSFLHVLCSSILSMTSIGFRVSIVTPDWDDEFDDSNSRWVCDVLSSITRKSPHSVFELIETVIHLQNLETVPVISQTNA